MDRVVAVQMPVKDVCGLYEELRKREFSVRNVAGDARLTYVYLDPSEQKDPTPVVQSWIEKMPQRLSRSLYEKNLVSEKTAREVEAARPKSADPITTLPVLEAPPEPQVSWYVKAFRKIGF